jgi:hypothetical protein
MGERQPLASCFLIGAVIRTRAGRSAREKVERAFFERIPGYACCEA